MKSNKMTLYKKYVLTGILVYCLFSSLLAQENFKIKELEINGVKSISESTLKKKLILKDRSNWQKLLFWKKAYQYHEADLTADLELIQNIYQKEGFIDVQIEHILKEQSDTESVEIKFVIDENDPVLIEKINYNLQVAESSDKSKLQHRLNQFIVDLPLKEGSRFRDEDLLLTKQELGNWLDKQGYAYQEVNYNLELKKDINRVIVDLTLNTGTICYFGETTFKGVEKVPYSILKKQLAPPGNIYSQTYLKKIQQKLQRLGMFQYVTVRSVLDDPKNKTIPILIELKEAARFSSKLAVGYGQEDKFRTSLTVTKLGFLGGIRKAVFFAKYSSLEPYNLSLKLTQPAIFHPDGSLTLNPFAKMEDESNYTISRIGSFLIYQISLSNYLSSYSKYGIEWNNLETSSPSLEDDLIAEGDGDYKQSSATIGMVFDNSAPMFSPTKGWYINPSFTWAGIGFNSDYHYTMTSAEVRKYTTIYKKFVLASRVQGGFMKSIKSSEVTPIADRFYGGGNKSVRGWDRYDLGPKSSDDLPLGGNSLLEASLELRYPIWKKLSGVVFCDAGNVWEGTYDHNLNDLEYAIGTGLRFKTLLGPIRVDVAVPVSQPIDNIQFYLNIGEAF